MSIELDYMEYASDVEAQAAYIASGSVDKATDGSKASADTVYIPGRSAAEAIDDINSTIWQSTHSSFPHWWKYDFGVGNSEIINTVTIDLTGCSSGGHYYLKDFKVQGSNNDSDWIDLYSGQHTDNANKETFNFSNSTAYRYYRIYILNSYVTLFNFAAMAETELIGDVHFQCYSESTIKQQGSYSLKAIANITNSLNNTLIKTIGAPIDLTNQSKINLNVYASRTGSNFKISIHDSGGTTTEKTINVLSVGAWQEIEWDISGVSNVNKDAIDEIKITILNADVENTFYIDNMFGDIFIYDYVGDLELQLILNSLYDIITPFIYSYYGDLELKLEPLSITEFSPVYDYIGNLELQLIPNSLYDLFKLQVYDYIGDLYLQLVPESITVFSTIFDYVGDLELQLVLNSESFFYFYYDYTGGLNLELVPNSSYNIGIGYDYLGNLELQLIPESIYNKGIDIVGALEFILSPEAIIEVNLIPAFRPIIKKPNKILPQIIKLFHQRGERVIVYLSYSRMKDPYEKTKIQYSLNSIAIKALVIDEAPSALVWMHGGLKETGAKSLLVEKNDLKILRTSNKLIIRGEEYVIFKEAEAHRHQIYEWSDYGVAIAFKKGYKYPHV